MYIVTQLGLWVAKPPAIAAEDGELMDTHGAEGAESRRALNERLTRGMTAEVAADVSKVVEKAGAVIAKSSTIVGEGAVDISKALLHFLQDRVIS
jgi:hypothetical protein